MEKIIRKYETLTKKKIQIILNNQLKKLKMKG